jgi:predicted dehydrogenase
MSKVKVGLIGAGQIAHYNCENIRAHSQAEVVAVADPSEERAKALQQKYGLARAYTDAAELLRDPDIDAVSIAVPNVFHASYSIASLQAGKHVMLDKPFALNLGEAEAVAKVARETGKVFTVAMNMRFREEAQRARLLIGKGSVGDVYHAKAYWFRRSGIPKLGTWFGQKSLAGGGVLLDIGVHLLDLALYLMDNFEPEAVSGATHHTFGHRGLGGGNWGLSNVEERVSFDVEDMATALIKLKGGATVSLEVSWAMHQPEPNRHNVEIYGSEAGITAFDSKFCRFGDTPENYSVTEPEKIAVPFPHQNRFINWIDACLGQDKVVCTLEQSLAVQKILDAVYASAAGGGEIRVS